MAETQSKLLSLPRELRDSIIEFAANDFLPIDITANNSSEAVEVTKALGATCHQLRAEANERFYWNNTSVVYISEQGPSEVMKAHAEQFGAQLSQFRRVIIEPFWDELPVIMLTRSAKGWKVEESYESFEEDEWLSMVKDGNLDATLEAVQAVLNGVEGLTVECVEKIRVAQEEIVKEKGGEERSGFEY